jgi:hypothetical protein
LRKSIAPVVTGQGLAECPVSGVRVCATRLEQSRIKWTNRGPIVDLYLRKTDLTALSGRSCDGLFEGSCATSLSALPQSIGYGLFCAPCHISLNHCSSGHACMRTVSLAGCATLRFIVYHTLGWGQGLGDRFSALRAPGALADLTKVGDIESLWLCQSRNVQLFLVRECWREPSFCIIWMRCIFGVADRIS